MTFKLYICKSGSLDRFLQLFFFSLSHITHPANVTWDEVVMVEPRNFTFDKEIRYKNKTKQEIMMEFYFSLLCMCMCVCTWNQYWLKFKVSFPDYYHLILQSALLESTHSNMTYRDYVKLTLIQYRFQLIELFISYYKRSMLQFRHVYYLQHNKVYFLTNKQI